MYAKGRGVNSVVSHLHDIKCTIPVPFEVEVDDMSRRFREQRTGGETWRTHCKALLNNYNGICSFISGGWKGKLQRAASRLLLTKRCHSNTDGCWWVFLFFNAIIRFLSTDGAGPVVMKHAQISMFFKGKKNGCLNKPCHNYTKNAVISVETIGWFLSIVSIFFFFFTGILIL